MSIFIQNQQTTVYSDPNLLLPAAGQNEIVTQGNVIVNALFMVLGTIRRQRLMQPAFGSYLYFLLFEPVSPVVAEQIHQEVFKTLTDPANGLLQVISVKYTDISVVAMTDHTYRTRINVIALQLNNLQITNTFTLVQN